MSFFSNLSTLFNAADRSNTANDQTNKNKAVTNKNRPQRPASAQARATSGVKNTPTSSKGKASNSSTGGKGSVQTTPQAPLTPVAPTLSASELARLKQEAENRFLAQAKVEADSLVREAQSKAREIIVEAKDEALATKIKADKESQVILRQAEEQQRDLTIKIDRIDQRLSQLDSKEKSIDEEQQRLTKLRQELTEQKAEVVKKYEQVSGLTQKEAREQLLAEIEKKTVHEMAQVVIQREEAARAEADEKAKAIIIEAMKYGATDYVPEYTSSVVALNSEDAKGKIIGKAGRNIHAFERITGVDVDLDASPTEVKLSSFDPVRREVAKISLEKLIKDGRIQPARIEEIVAKTQKEINKITFDEGRNLCHSLGIYNLPNELMQLLGRFKYRFSYGQNLIAHTLEVTKIGVKIAHELGLNVQTVKLGCLLHDIGKVSDEVEGSHVELGIKMLKKYNLPKEVIATIAEHHEDTPFSSFESMAVHIADAISGARPGARYENYEEYVQRLQKLEEIANEYPEVQKSYAIQAGREIRVMLEPSKSKDDDVTVLANRIRDQIKEQVTYPGTVTVTVIREERGSAVAN